VKRKDDPEQFWAAARKLPRLRGRVPDEVTELFTRSLPGRGLPYRVFRRQGGVGSLGRPRLVAIAEWHGGLIGREAKALVRSGIVWARGKRPAEALQMARLLATAVRCPDPHVRVKHGWVLRRFGPQTGRLELRRLSRRSNATRMLRAMGWETGNVHAGTAGAHRKVLHDLSRRRPSWLLAAARQMNAALRRDFRRWSGYGDEARSWR